MAFIKVAAIQMTMFTMPTKSGYFGNSYKKSLASTEKMLLHHAAPRFKVSIDSYSYGLCLTVPSK